MSDKTSNNDKQGEECGCFVEPRTRRPCPPIRNVTHPLRYYEFTPEEIKTLEECDRESFYRRCLPLSGLFAGATYAAIRTGHLKRSRHFGSVPKLVAAAVAGHVAGRAAHAPACAERLRAPPQPSRLGELARQHHDDGANAAQQKK